MPAPIVLQTSLAHWFLALRVKTLTAAVVPIVVATSLAYSLHHQVYLGMALWALLSSVFIQIGTNLINDALDFKKGTDGEGRLGPQRVSQSGLVPPQLVLQGGFFCFFLALLCGIPLVFHGGWPIVVIGIISLFCGYIYTGGPYPLAYVGLGDLFVVIFFGIVAVGGVFYLHTRSWGWEAFVAGLQIGFLATVLIAINNLRDAEGDRTSSKKTLAVRFGRRFSLYEITALLYLCFLLNLFWIMKGQWLAGLLTLVLLPLAQRIIRGLVVEPPGPSYNSYLAQAALLHLLFGLQLSLGFILLR